MFSKYTVLARERRRIAMGDGPSRNTCEVPDIKWMIIVTIYTI